MTAPIITLLTDFGERDGYVGAMKGVILSANPAARIVDISHDTPRQDVLAGAIVLANATRWFPPGCIHTAVVDPGVGSRRRAIAAVCGQATYVLPDNGLITLVHRRDPIREAYAIEDEHFRLAELSGTFHGRDLFAPAAARLSLGVPPSAAGPKIADPMLLDLPFPELDPAGGWARGQILYVDIYGNLISNIPNEAIVAPPQAQTLRIGSQTLQGLRRTYSDVPPGEALFLAGSSGHVEVAVREGDAASYFQTAVGAGISVQSKKP